MNHMTNACGVLCELDTNIIDSIKFVDDFDEKLHFKLSTSEQTLCRYTYFGEAPS